MSDIETSVVLSSYSPNKGGLPSRTWKRELVALYSTFWREEGKDPPKDLKPFPDRSVYRFLVLAHPDDFKARGMTTLIVHFDELGTSRIGLVEGVYVLPEYRGRGYSRQLLEEVLDTATRLGISLLELTSNSNKPGRAVAIRLYEQLGFVREDRTNGGTDLYRLRL